MLAAILITAGAVVASVYVHLGVLRLLWRVHRLRLLKRGGLAILVLGALVGHLVEIGLFAAGIGLIRATEGPVHGEGATELSHLETLYYSATSYTSLGGSPLPTRELRLLTAVEALTGLILITWTASFIFLVMQRRWGWEGE